MIGSYARKLKCKYKMIIKRRRVHGAPENWRHLFGVLSLFLILFASSRFALRSSARVAVKPAAQTPTVQFSQTAYSVSESAGSIAITITCLRPRSSFCNTSDIYGEARPIRPTRAMPVINSG
jgi:hypothetical protein